MAIKTYDIDYIYDILQTNLKNKKILSVGSHSVSFRKLSKKIEILFPNKSKNWNENIPKLKTQKSHYEFLKELFLAFGAEAYDDLDLNDYSKIKIDLSKEDLLENNIENFNKYGIIINNGTIDYVTNIVKAYKFILNLCVVDGYIISTADCNTFNRFPLQPSPEFLVDIHNSLGFDCEKLELFDGENNFIQDYNLNFVKKHSYLVESLSIYRFILFLLWQIKVYSGSFFDDYDKINPSHYSELKKNNFEGLKDKQDKLRYNYKTNFFIRLFNLIVDRIRLDKGRIVVRSVFVKRGIGKNSKSNSSSLYYQIKYKSRE